MKHTIYLIITALLPVAANAQSLGCDDGLFHWEAGFNVGLNNDGYGINLHTAYFPVQYAGIKVNLGFAGEIEEVSDWGNHEWETRHNYAIRFKFNPAIAIRSPRIIRWKSQNAGFYIFTEPGITLSPGAAGSLNAKHFSWDVKSGINMQIDRYILTIGYGISDFSLYSGAPISHNGIPENTNYITHTVFIGGAYKF